MSVSVSREEVLPLTRDIDFLTDPTVGNHVLSRSASQKRPLQRPQSKSPAPTSRTKSAHQIYDEGSKADESRVADEAENRSKFTIQRKHSSRKKRFRIKRDSNENIGSSDLTQKWESKPTPDKSSAERGVSRKERIKIDQVKMDAKDNPEKVRRHSSKGRRTVKQKPILKPTVSLRDCNTLTHEQLPALKDDNSTQLVCSTGDINEFRLIMNNTLLNRRVHSQSYVDSATQTSLENLCIEKQPCWLNEQNQDITTLNRSEPSGLSRKKSKAKFPKSKSFLKLFRSKSLTKSSVNSTKKPSFLQTSSVGNLTFHEISPETDVKMSRSKSLKLRKPATARDGAVKTLWRRTVNTLKAPVEAARPGNSLLKRAHSIQKSLKEKFQKQSDESKPRDFDARSMDPVYSLLKCAADLPKGGITPTPPPPESLSYSRPIAPAWLRPSTNRPKEKPSQLSSFIASHIAQVTFSLAPLSSTIARVPSVQTAMEEPTGLSQPHFTLPEDPPVATGKMRSMIPDASQKHSSKSKK